MENKGSFITFEGPDGSGKTTNCLLAIKYLQKMGYKVLHTREPGGTALAEFIRKLLLDPGTRIVPLTELLLYAASRAQHVTEVIRPALARGEIVVCDRYADATVAYQGYGRKLNLKLIDTLNKIATDGLMPGLTILLDVPAKEGLSRAEKGGKKKDRLEREKISFHNRVRRGYLTLAKKEPGRIKIVASDRQVNKTNNKVIEVVNKFMGIG